ncbi:MAG TPA: caspase family protein, partial [Vicinamibacterales bacterium]|nr:caspase family protein [Vicinamibacterales bacterium]
TVFYFAGHGVQRDKEDAVLCLQDFREPPAAAPALRRAIDLATLRAGLSPSSSQPNVARTQFYFVDACREQPEQAKNFKDLKTGDLWDIELDGQDDRSSPIFYGSISNQVAAAVPGARTLFNQALLACLTGDGGDSLGVDGAGDPVWGVTVESLNIALREKIDEINRDVGGDQTYSTGGQFKPAAICLLDGPPTVTVTLEIDPEQACQVSSLTITDNDQVARNFAPPLTHPIQDTLPAGLYTVALSFTPPAPPFVDRMRNREARAPRSSWKMKVV